MSQVKIQTCGTRCLIEEYEEVFVDEDDDCEIELVVQGRTISVSEKLLCQHSLYFKQVFQDFDSDQETIILKHKQVAGEDLPDERQQEPLSLISFITMTTITEYLCTGILKINDQNIRQLLYASELLKMPAVESQCFTYLKSELTVRNCVKSYLLASAKKSWISLATFIRNFIIVHFDQVKKLGSFYTLFNAEQMKEILRSNDLNIKFEEEIVDVIFTWISVDKESRKFSLPTLLTFVQWELIRTEEYFEKCESEATVQNHDKCKNLLTQGKLYSNMSYDEKLSHWNRHKKPGRWPKQIAALSYAEKLIECYDFESGKWFVLTEKPGHVFGSAMCSLQGKLYTIGGVQSKQVDQYDIESDTWKDFFPSLRHCRVAHGVTVDDDTIYVTGGSAKANANFGPGLSEMECCKVDKDGSKKPEWKTIGTMAEGRSFLGSTVLAGKVYQMAGCINEDFSTNEVWDPKSGKFEQVANCLSKRDSQGQTNIDGEIYVVGGYDNISSKYLKTVERYNPDTNKWTRLPSMNTPRRSPGVVSYRKYLYAIGGMGVDDDLSSIEVYNPFSNQGWSYLNQDMKEVNGWCSAALIDKPVRTMMEKVNKKPLEDCDIDWETETGDESSGSQTLSPRGQNSNWDWDKSTNARTQQRLKQMKNSSK